MKPGLLRKLLVAGVSLHSIALGAAMLTVPQQILRLFGWQSAGPMFFPEQSGIFLVILGMAYAAGLWQRSFAWFLVISKAIAVVFLVAEYIRGAAPTMALHAAALDGLMCVVVGSALAWEVISQRRRCDTPG